MIAITITIGLFFLCNRCYEAAGKPLLLQPVVISILVLCIGLWAFGIPIDKYDADTSIMQQLLAPAIIALAIPVYQNIRSAGRVLPLILLGTAIAGTVIVISAVAFGLMLELDSPMLHALSTKSISAPFAISVAQSTQTPIPWVVVAVFSTGLPGAMLAPSIARSLGVTDERILGLTLGMTSHAFGIAKATEISQTATAFATLGMGLMGCYIAIFVTIANQLTLPSISG